MARDEHATNRLFIDGLALALSGLLAERRRAGRGRSVAVRRHSPLAARADGTFDEAGGEDTSYHNVAILIMQVYALYAGPSPALDDALARAVRWALPRVSDAGEIDIAGNSRTGRGQETYFGQAKDVNYGECAAGAGLLRRRPLRPGRQGRRGARLHLPLRGEGPGADPRHRRRTKRIVPVA